MKRLSPGLAVMRSCLIGAVLVFVVGLGPVAASAQAAPTATITGGTVNPTWTSGTVDNITVNYDGANPWTVIAGTLPAAFGYCGSSFSSWYGADPFPDQQEGWRNQYSSTGGTGPGTLNSGPIQLLLNGAYGQRFCVYVLESFHPAIDPTVTIYATTLLASKLLTVETPPTPPTPPPPSPPSPPPPTTNPMPGGTSPASGGTTLGVKVTAPKLTGLRLAPAGFKAAKSGPSALANGRTGARVSFTLDKAATVTFIVERSQPGRLVKGSCRAQTFSNRTAKSCTRWVAVTGSFKWSAKAGNNSLRFTGRIAGHKLPVGSYRLVAVPRDRSGISGQGVPARFAIRS